MSNKRHHRDHELPGADAHPPSGWFRRLLWRCRRWLGVS
jgi:hypothetical protein